MIRSATLSDVEAVATIYNYYIKHSCVTFEEEPVSTEEMRVRMTEVQVALPWVILEDEGVPAGYAYASKWKGRCAYRHTVESTIYLDHKKVGKGFGTQLYCHLLEVLRDKHVHVVIGGVALPNIASVSLHEKLGFEKVAHFKQVGSKFGRWIDVGYWQIVFD